MVNDINLVTIVITPGYLSNYNQHSFAYQLNLVKNIIIMLMALNESLKLNNLYIFHYINLKMSRLFIINQW